MYEYHMACMHDTFLCTGTRKCYDAYLYKNNFVAESQILYERKYETITKCYMDKTLLLVKL